MFFLDRLSLFFCVLTLLAAAATLLSERQNPLRVALASLALLLAYVTAALPLMVLAYGLAMLVAGFNHPLSTRDRPIPLLARFDGALRAILWGLLPCAALGVAGTALWLSNGSWLLNTPLNVLTGYTSLVFSFVLLATLVGVGGFAPVRSPFAPETAYQTLWPASLVTTAWLYPLLRLRTIVPWNAGWYQAVLLAGGVLALWGAWQAFAASMRYRADPTAAPGDDLSAMLWRLHAGMALAGIGMGTPSGVVVCCYALLVLLLVETTTPLCTHSNNPRNDNLWFLGGTIPLTAPFMSVWMGASAAVAHQQGWVALALWGAVMLTTLTIANRPMNRRRAPLPNRPRRLPLFAPPRPPTLAGWVRGWVARWEHGPPAPDRFGSPPLPPADAVPHHPRSCTLAAASSVVLGIATLPIVQHLLRPVAHHVPMSRGGPTSNLWPWGHVLPTSAPSEGLAGLSVGLSLMLVLLLLVPGLLAWLTTRLPHQTSRTSD